MSLDNDMRHGFPREALVEMARVILEELRASGTDGGRMADFGRGEDAGPYGRYEDEPGFGSYAGDLGADGSFMRPSMRGGAVPGPRMPGYGPGPVEDGFDLLPETWTPGRDFSGAVPGYYPPGRDFSGVVPGLDTAVPGFGGGAAGGFRGAYSVNGRGEPCRRAAPGRGGGFGLFGGGDAEAQAETADIYEAESPGLGSLPEKLSELFCRDSRRYDGEFERL